jgi:hypothetical protein
MEGIEVPETEKRKIKQDRHVSPAKPETRIKNPPTKRVQALQSKKEVAPVVQIPKIIRKPRLRQTEPTQSQESQVKWNHLFCLVISAKNCEAQRLSLFYCTVNIQTI